MGRHAVGLGGGSSERSGQLGELVVIWKSVDVRVLVSDS